MGKLIVGNWKMHGLAAALCEIEAVAAGQPADVDMAVCPPFTLIDRAVRAAAGSRLQIGAQNIHAEPHGAHTGDISAGMLVDVGATLVIVGHSERRADCAETDADVLAKARAAVAAGLTTIVCVGESADERDAGRAVAVVAAQLAGSLPADRTRLVVAYEPVWAIGTGCTPTADDVAAMHAMIRAAVGAELRILYGGSVTPGNAAELLAIVNVDGVLVGGASLTAAGLLAIAAAARD